MKEHSILFAISNIKFFQSHYLLESFILPAFVDVVLFTLFLLATLLKLLFGADNNKMATNVHIRIKNNIMRPTWPVFNDFGIL